jgi:uncharacterized protein
MTEPAPRKGIVERFISFVVDHPKKAMLVGLLILVAAAPGVKRLYSDVTYRIWFAPDDPHIARYDAFERRFGSDTAVSLIVHSPSGLFDRDSAQLLIDLTREMEKVREVVRVDSPSNYSWVHAEGDELIVEPLIPDDMELTDELLAERHKAALADELLPGYLVSKDAKTGIFYGWLRPSLGGLNDDEAVMADMTAIVEKYKGRGDHVFYMTGQPVLEGTFKQANKDDMRRLVRFIFGLAILVLTVFLRRASAVVLSMGTVILSIVCAMAMAGWLGFGLNSMTLVLPEILIAVPIAYAVHILSFFFRGLNWGLPRKDAMRFALREYLVPMFFANLTTLVGFGSFYSASIQPLQHLGILAALGTVFAWSFIHLILCPASVLLPLKPRHWPKGARPGAGAAVEADLKDEVPPRYKRYAAVIEHNRWYIVIGAVLVTVLAVVLATRNTVNYDPFEFFTEDEPINQAHDFLEERMNWMRSVEVVIDSGKEEGIKDPAFLKKVEAFQRWLDAKPYVGRTLSIIDFLKATHKSLNGDDPKQYRLADSREAVAQEYLLYTMNLPEGKDLNDRVALRNDAMRMTVWWRLRDSRSSLAAVDELQKKAKEFGLDVHVTGKSMLYQLMSTYFVGTFTKSLAIALIAITLLLVICFRSVRVALIMMIPNVVPLAVAAALFYVFGRPLDISSTFVYSVALGFAIDNTVYVVLAFQERRRAGISPRESLARVYAANGPAIVVGTLALAAAFSVLSMATFVPLRYFGLMTTTILILGAVSDLIVTPAILMLWKRTGTR